MRRRCPSLACWILCSLFVLPGVIDAAETGHGRTFDTNEVWLPNRTFPKLTCPQWVGEDGVECVVVLAIDDMRDSAKYEAYLRPILQRLKAIDGRAALSIMTCAVKPDDPQLQSWLQEGVSLECHTSTHPCPLFANYDFAASKATYDQCVELLSSVPNNVPVAFRTPCCDSLNTVTPRFYSEIFGKTTPAGKSLQLDSSVFTVYTADDPEIPRDQLYDADGREKFRKYIPRGLKRGDQMNDHFVNLIENYPYPYVIQNTCWQFPCMVPSDWSANHLHQPNNPETVRDLKIALDITVQKQGVFDLVFHPHGWIKAEQVVELIDHAVATHGKKVKFLNFRECVERLNQHLLDGRPLRNERGGDNGVRLCDVTDDGFMDVIFEDGGRSRTRVWQPDQRVWVTGTGPQLAEPPREGPRDEPIAWQRGGVIIGRTLAQSWHIQTWNPEERKWSFDHRQDAISKGIIDYPPKLKTTPKLLAREVLGDGSTQLLIQSSPAAVGVLTREPESMAIRAHEWFPKGVFLRDAASHDTGVRLVDLDGDTRLDLVISNHEQSGAWLFESVERGWATELFHTKRGEAVEGLELPLIVRPDGSDNGFFVRARDRELCWINEETSDQPDLMRRVPFDRLLGDRLPTAKSPTAAIQSMRVQAGFQIDLVAHEPLTMDPIGFDWGPDGKFWVVEMADYPLGMDGKGAAGGRIRILQDTNSDGRYDTSTVFLDQVPYPSGVLAWKKGVLVSAAPDLFYAEDTDGDGKCDHREVLYTGFVEGNQQHRVNGFTRGLDQWLYLANGDSGGTVKSLKTGKSLDLRGYDLRIRPETGEMDAVVGASQFGRHRDDWGNWFGNNNSRPMWHFRLDDAYLRRNPNLAPPSLHHDVSVTPGAAPVFPSSKTLTRFNDFHTANRFTSACGAIVYRDNRLFPIDPGGAGDSTRKPNDVWHTFVSEPVHNLVHHELMSADGTTFTSRRPMTELESEFLSSTDNWFRPTMVKTGPDGALWVADMYRLVIEHPQWIPIEWQRKLNVRAGDDKGRIWRVSAQGTQPVPVPRFDNLRPAELVKQLDSPNGWQRDLVQQLLVDAAEPSTIPLLQAQAARSPNPLCRLHSLCTLDGIAGGLTPELLATALMDPHPGVRRHAIRLLESLPAVDAAILTSLERLFDDADPQVRMQLAYTLGTLPGPQAGKLLGRLARSAHDDDYLTAAVMSSLNKGNLADVMSECLQPNNQSTALLQQLLEQAAAFEDNAAVAALVLRATDRSAGSPFARWQYEAVEGLQTALARRSQTLTDWLKEPGVDGKQLQPSLDTLFQSARQVARDHAADVGDRTAAIRILGMDESDLATLEELFAPQESPEVQSASLASLAHCPSATVGELLLKRYRSLAPAIRGRACETLLSRESWKDELLKALEAGELAAADLDAANRQRLLADKSSSIRERAARVFEINHSTDRAQLVASYLPTVRVGGDAQRGQQLFQKTCSQCHKLGNLGHVVGPDLTSLADKSAEVLLTAVLDPNRAVEARYLTFTAVTKSGISHSGIIASEATGSVTLRSAEGKEVTLLRSELDELQSSTKSLMPEGLEKDLKPNDAADLISYIRQNLPLPALKQFPGNAPRTIAPDDAGRLTLSPLTAEIYGSTITLEEHYQNLGWWSSSDDMAIWTVQIPHAGKYAVAWTWACDPQAAGNSVTVEAGGKSFTRSVKQTAGWDDYQTEQLGELELPAGEVRVKLKPASRPLPALADVKSVTLSRNDK